METLHRSLEQPDAAVVADLPHLARQLLDARAAVQPGGAAGDPAARADQIRDGLAFLELAAGWDAPLRVSAIYMAIWDIEMLDADFYDVSGC